MKLLGSLLHMSSDHHTVNLFHVSSLRAACRALEACALHSTPSTAAAASPLPQRPGSPPLRLQLMTQVSGVLTHEI